MPYSEKIAARIRLALQHLPQVEEKKMFGGLAFMVDNKICITVGANRIMCRIEPSLHDEAIKKAGCSTVIMGGRNYKGYVHVNEESIKTKKDFDHWIALGLAYNKVVKTSKK